MLDRQAKKDYRRSPSHSKGTVSFRYLRSEYADHRSKLGRIVLVEPSELESMGHSSDWALSDHFLEHSCFVFIPSVPSEGHHRFGDLDSRS